MKIFYSLNSILHHGGIAAITLLKINALAKKGHKVYLALSDHDINIHIDLENNVELINLKINYYEDDWKSRVHILKGIFIKRLKHKKKIKSLLNQIQPDIVISVGQSEKYFLPEIKGKWKTIREFHYDKGYRIRRANNFFQKMIAILTNLYDYNYKIKKYDHIVLLTEEDKKNWNRDNISVIPNPTILNNKCISLLDEKKIVSVGRLVEQKNFKSLIKAFKKVVEKHPDWKLDIYGEGNLKNDLQTQIRSANLSNNIFLKGFSENHNEIYGKSSIFVLTSIYEGFPLVLLEAMSFGLPLISYDCPCGPKDLIKNGENGYLLPLGNENMLSSHINKLIENKEKRVNMGNNGRKYIEDYNIEKIIKKWLELFDKLLYK